MPQKERRKLSFKNYVDIYVSIGAAAVIFAAWAKLTHQPFANELLAIGMWSETAIFLVYAILAWKSPEADHPSQAGKEAVLSVSSEPIPVVDTQKILHRISQITPENIESLGKNFQKLDNTVSHLADIGDVVKGTGEFSAKTREANLALGKMKDAFEHSATTMTDFNGIVDSAKGFKDNVNVLTQTLGNLNSVYEQELNEGSNNLRALNGFYDKIAKASEAMDSTVSDAQRTKDQINILANNLGKLNQVYGNMLSAMQGNRN